MLDFDLAEAYGVETSQLKRQVRRNIERFEGDDFMIELTRDELSRCQIGTLNIKRGQNLHDQNDINESTRAQLDAISTDLAELQAKPSDTKTRKPIGFIQPEDDDDKK